MASALVPFGLRLLPQHLAHLRSVVVEGMPLEDSARRYLNIQHGAEAMGAHRAVVDLAAAVARRHSDSCHRLLHVVMPTHNTAPLTLTLTPPTLDDWAEAEGLSDWSADELQAFYSERFPQGQGDGRRQKRTERQRRARLALLRRLEALTAEPAKPTDAIAGWLDPLLADRLLRIGYYTLGELQERIAQGGRWWAGLKGFGITKAERVQQQILMLLGPSEAPAWARVERGPALDGRFGTNRAPAVPGALSANDDKSAVQRWIEARAGSPQTIRTYEREAERFMLWMLARGRALSDAGTDDCTQYKQFLANVPPDWISYRNAPRLQAGWAPFSGQLTAASQRQAITILSSLFAFLTTNHYLASNPWLQINRRVADDKSQLHQVREMSRAFTPEAWDALTSHLPALPAAAAARMRWLLFFMRATGLRSAELLAAQRGDFICDRHWWLRVMGKGAKERIVPVPAVVMEATRTYFDARGLDFDTADKSVVLLSSLEAAEEPRTDPLAYSTLYGLFTRFVRAAVRASKLTDGERSQALRASAHWLRHTHATRAAEAGMQPDVLQANLGQADPRTTAIYYRAQNARRHEEIERIYGAH